MQQRLSFFASNDFDFELGLVSLPLLDLILLLLLPSVLLLLFSFEFGLMERFPLRLLFEVGCNKLEARGLIFNEEMLPFLLKESFDCLNGPVFAFSSFKAIATALARRSELLAETYKFLLLSSFDGVLLLSVLFLGRSVGDSDGGGDGGDREGNSLLSSILTRLRVSFSSSSSSSSLLSLSHKLIIPFESEVPLTTFR